MDHRRSLLLQFKIDGRGGASPDQKELYAHWPSFEYSSAAELGGQRRYPHPKQAHGGGRFAVVHRGQKPNGWANSQTLTQYGQKQSSLTNDIVDMIFGASGKKFTGSPRTDGWSKMVNDLLEVTARRKFNLDKIRNRRAGVGKDALACMSFGGEIPVTLIEAVGDDPDVLNALLSCSNDDPNTPPVVDYDDVDDDAAVSVIVIELNAG